MTKYIQEIPKCQTDLIEKAINLGFMEIIPPSLSAKTLVDSIT